MLRPFSYSRLKKMELNTSTTTKKAPLKSAKKEDRVSFEEIYMNLALSLARRSTCRRLQVGCVIVSEDNYYIYGLGYNGNAKGFPNTCDSSEPGKCGCLHAEENALLKTNQGDRFPKTAFVSHQPCAYCAKRMINKEGFKKLYYAHSYRSQEGLEILKQASIEVKQFLPKRA